MIAPPPPEIAYRITGSHLSGVQYAHQSKRLADGLDTVLAAHGLRIDQFKSVLDFGCGCGRIISHYAYLSDAIKFYGTDIDEVGINWCREHMPRIDFSVNSAEPPLNWPDGQFDL